MHIFILLPHHNSFTNNHEIIRVPKRSFKKKNPNTYGHKNLIDQIDDFDFLYQQETTGKGILKAPNHHQ